MKKFDEVPHTAKVVSISSNTLTNNDIDKILWFAFSDTGENHLFLNPYPLGKVHPSKIKLTWDFQKYLTIRNFMALFFLSMIAYHLAFIPPLSMSLFYAYRSYDELKKESYDRSKISSAVSASYLGISKKLFTLARPTWLLFGVALYPDTAIDLNSRGLTVINEASGLISQARDMQSLIFKRNKTDNEKDDLTLRFKRIKEGLSVLNDNLSVINQKLPAGLPAMKKFKTSLIEIVDLIGKSGKIVDYLENQITSPSEKKYLIFFANNRELRPGGGFLGSFGILKIGNYEIQGIQVYDVYDADGQLTVHIDPPEPLSKYLGVPHWFLRDSNFTPDFLQNYQEALFFLEKEMDMKDFSGSVLITTSAIENVLNAFGNLYIPDYNEYINAKNFYIKTQSYVEKDFFPGSTQKRNYLSLLMNQIFINLDQVSLKSLGHEIKKSLDEKQIVVYVNDPTVQTFFDSSFWSGRVIEPKCTLPQNCIADYLFPYDTNVGANKANYFVNRSMYLKTNIDDGGNINHLLSIQYKNNSPSLVFPTGLYRNYFQVLLPINSVVNQVTKNGVKVDEVDQKDDTYKTIGFFFEVKPGETADVKIDYALNNAVVPDRQIYQFVIQKQIGASNSDFVLELTTGKNIYVLNQNFSPVVKGREIIYNTNLSTDKIFLVELMKQ